MKALFSILAVAALLGGCGMQGDSTSNTTASRARWHATTIATADIEVTAINGGFNPTFFGYRIDARIMTGSNACLARGVKARLVKERRADVIHVRAEITDPDLKNVRCTREFMPQYADVSIEIRADRTRVRDVLIDNVDTMGNSVSIETLGQQSHGAVISGVSLEPTNGGFNPDAFALIVTGQVTLGSNPCFAHGVTVEMVSTVVGREIHVRAVRDESATEGRICTMEYNPVSTTVTTTVRGMRSDIDSVVVHNVGAMGKTLVHATH